MPHTGAIYSIDTRLKRDGRTREARLVKRLRNDLIAQCGGTVSASQRLLIDRIGPSAGPAWCSTGRTDI
jgi:hypothetical protein